MSLEVVTFFLDELLFAANHPVKRQGFNLSFFPYSAYLSRLLPQEAWLRLILSLFQCSDTNLIGRFSFFHSHLIHEEKKKNWRQLRLYPGSITPQATTRPWFFGHVFSKDDESHEPIRRTQFRQTLLLFPSKLSIISLRQLGPNRLCYTTCFLSIEK